MSVQHTLPPLPLIAQRCSSSTPCCVICGEIPSSFSAGVGQARHCRSWCERADAVRGAAQACLLSEEDVQGILVMCTYLTRLLAQLSGNRTLFSYVPEVRPAALLRTHRHASCKASSHLVLLCAVRASQAQGSSETSDAVRAPR